MHCYSHNLQCHKASTCTLPVRYDAKAMAEERELYRTRIHEFVPKTNGVMIVSSARLIIRWDYGEVAQYPLHHIRSVMASSDVRHVYFQKRPRRPYHAHEWESSRLRNPCGREACFAN